MKNTDKPKNYRYIFKYAKRYFIWAVAAVAATVLFSILEVEKADLLRQIVDLAQMGSIDGIFGMFIKAAVVILLIMLCVFISDFAAGRFSAGFIRDIKSDSARKVGKIPMDAMTAERSGEILSKMSADADSVQDFMEHDFINIMQFPFMIVFYSVFMLRLNPLLFGACFILVPVLVVLGMSFALPFKEGSRKYMAYLGKVSNTVADMAGGISMVKSYNMEDNLNTRYGRGIKKATDMALSNDRMRYKGRMFFNLARHIPIYVCLIFGGFLCFRGSLTLGALVAFFTLINQILGPLVSSYQMFFSVRAASASAERLFSLLNEPSEREGGVKTAELREDVPAIEFRNVSFGYEKGKPVLQDLSLKVFKGEQLGFAGHSGCGKSTILGLLCGFYKPDAGKILVGGTDIEERELASLRSLISYVSQEAYLFPFSIYDNIAMGKPGASREEVFAAAKAACAHDFIMETEHGYETTVGERGCRLSGGQVQRISIARAILKDAPILLLDEATSALDVKAEAEVQQAIDNLSRGRTVLVVAHRLSTIKEADRIAVIDGGAVAELGSHEELMELGGVYSALNRGGAEE